MKGADVCGVGSGTGRAGRGLPYPPLGGSGFGSGCGGGRVLGPKGELRQICIGVGVGV